jgi:hypothetical protein
MTARWKGCNIDRGKATASRQVFSALVPGQLFSANGGQTSGQRPAIAL